MSQTKITQTCLCDILQYFTSVKMIIFRYFSYFCAKHRLWVHSEAVLISTHNLCSRAKIRENVYPCKPQLYYMSSDMRKPDFCICKNKAADQLCSNWVSLCPFYQQLFSPIEKNQNYAKFHLITEKYSKNTRSKILSKNAAAFSFRISKNSRENNLNMCT